MSAALSVGSGGGTKSANAIRPMKNNAARTGPAQVATRMPVKLVSGRILPPWFRMERLNCHGRSSASEHGVHHDQGRSLGDESSPRRAFAGDGRVRQLNEVP